MTDNKKIKNLILLMAVISLVSFTGVGTLIYYIDPFFHYHKPVEGFAYVIDNQLTQNPGMAERFDYDSVILGSSMTVNFETDDFRELMGLNTIKLSYSSAYPRDISNITEKVFMPYDDGREKNIKAVFLGLDIITYSGAVDETKYPVPEYLYDTNVINDVKYLLNKDVLLNYVLRPMIAPEPVNLSHIYASWWTDEYYDENRVLNEHEMPEHSDEAMAADAFAEPIRDNLDVNIIPYIEAHPETEFYIFFPPYSILFWYDVMVENHLDATLNAYRTVEESLNKYENVRMYFFPADKETVTNLNNYADYSHYHPDINRYMTECFKNGNNMIAKRSESGRHMDEYMDELEAMLEDYDFDYIDERMKKR